jgi:hypothetical protein
MRAPGGGVMPDPAWDLAVPDPLKAKWPGIAALAQNLYAQAIAQSPELTEAVRRLATDQRMEQVWRQLFKRDGGAARQGAYMFRPLEKRIHKHPHWSAINGLSQQPKERERLQEQACMLIFSVAVGFFWRRSYNIDALRVRTIREVTAEVNSLRRHANRLREVAAEECEFLGQGPDNAFVVILRNRADFILNQAKLLQSQVKLPVGKGREVPNPWILEREGKASKDRWLRGFVIDMTNTCRVLFGQDLPGIVAIISSVAFNSTVINEATVRGMTEHRTVKKVPKTP